MLQLIKIFNSRIQGYWYIPENKTPGIVEYDEVSGVVNVVILSSYDVELGAPYYANKAKSAVLRMLEDGNFPDNKFFAWG